MAEALNMKIKSIVISGVCALVLTGCSNVGISAELESEIRYVMENPSQSNQAQGNQSAASKDTTHYLLDDERALYKATEAYRYEKGLPYLEEDEVLNEIARIRAKEIADTWSNTRADGTKCADLVKEKGCKYTVVSENLARYYVDADEVVEEWKHSKKECQSMLGDYTKTGVGVYEQKGLKYYVQIFAK